MHRAAVMVRLSAGVTSSSVGGYHLPHTGQHRMGGLGSSESKRL